jgi:hypothetical protein
MPRPIGARIREVCEIVEAIGPSCPNDIWPWTEKVIEKSNLSKYLQRAVSLGLMTAKGQRPVIYGVVDNWRDKMNEKRPYTYRPKPVYQAIPSVNSVWSMAA